jgi:hypothetical protein
LHHDTDRRRFVTSTKEAEVAIARIVTTHIGTAEYDQMRESLGISDTPPAGGLFHVAAIGDDGNLRIVEVWETREQAEAWGDKVAAARQAADLGEPPSIEYLEVHNIIQP